jgi:hypothetical protein
MSKALRAAQVAHNHQSQGGSEIVALFTIAASPFWQVVDVTIRSRFLLLHRRSARIRSLAKEIAI